MKKFDAVTWIGLALCAAALFWHTSHTAKLAQEQAELERLRQIEESHKKPTEELPGAITHAEDAQPQDEANTAPDGTPTDFPEKLSVIETPGMVFQMTNHGGGVKYAEFKEQLAVGSEEKHVRLNRFGTLPVGAFTNSGLSDGLGLTYEIHKTGSGSIEYKHQTGEGLQILKQWKTVPAEQTGADYLLKLTIALKNANGQSPLSLGGYGLYTGSAAPLYKREWEQQTGLFVAYEKKKFLYHDVNWFKGGTFKKSQNDYREEFADVLYGGTSNQFFANILSPNAPYGATYIGKPFDITLPEAAGGGDKKGIAGVLSLPNLTLAPGETRSFGYELFMGPKEYLMVRKLGRERGKVMHYGLFGILSPPLNWMLVTIHDKIFDPIAENWAWGLAVVLLTLIIRTLIWPLHNISTRSMKRMSKLQPMMKELREKHADDPQKLNTEMLKLYREYKINPAGGCLPMLLQMPIFFGFYKMLQHAVELRDQGFLWVKDLSQPDTIYTIQSPFPLPFIGSEIPVNLLPILMAVTMVGQMAVTPKTGDKMQQRLFLLMPLIFFFFCYNFASALALYWTTQNIFSIGQTLLMQRLPEPELKKAAPGQKSWMEKLQERADEAQKMRQQMARQQAHGGQKNKSKKIRGSRTGG